MNDRLTQRPSRSQRSSRSGQAMVEFAIISFLLTAMLSAFLGLIVLGLGSFQNNLAAESAGRLLDRKLPKTLTTSQEVYQELKTSGKYDEANLVISSANWYDSTFRSGLPEINRALLGSFIYDPDLEAFRYPGAVVKNAADEQTVLIPLLKDTTPPVAKGIDRALNVSSGDTPVSDDWVGPVSVSKIDDKTYRVVIFYPSQPGSMLNLEVVRDNDGRIVSQNPIEANDSTVSLYVACRLLLRHTAYQSRRGQLDLSRPIWLGRFVCISEKGPSLSPHL